ncbi:receiver box response regulator [Natronomonas moolapensis 8.8.11]|uniref:Receiver box response regulator n=1 Tax=Natronomonas moolapensis (strain DSM 18674 / CECT 7526 / JCM 14361 / 8.8.11) TaxID=268739 RepID=M1XQ02_NATM8|nr:response regulator [Natronomonas moolapensis]CCQ36192.1 receiver box response regulator [Natronomonas moolapensis 8.8.11]
MAGPTRVLLVDDDPSLADLMASQLADIGDRFSIRVETDPSDALEAVETGRFDCVVSDHHMPRMTGLELLRYVREMDPDLPFILFTARGSEEIASEAVSEGVTDYFRKRRGSDQWHVLANRIENAAARYRAEEAVQRRESALRELARTVIDSVSTPIEALCELGCRTLKVEYGALLTGTDGNAEILVESAEKDFPFQTGDGVPLSDGVDDLTVDGNGIVAVAADESEETGFSSYIGIPVSVGERRYGTLCFCDRGDRTEFAAWERAFVELLGDWLGHELTSEWARDQSDAVRSARGRVERALGALENDDDEAARNELIEAYDLLDRAPPAAAAVSIELS